MSSEPHPRPPSQSRSLPSTYPRSTSGTVKARERYTSASLTRLLAVDEPQDPDEQPARVRMNKAVWRAATIACSVIVLGLVAALLSQAGLWSGKSEPHPEPLTTLALVLAILAFFVQIFVFIFQSNASSRSTQRSEELNARTHVALDKIEANSAATQKVLFSQFDRLLDYIVGGVRSPDGDSDQNVEMSLIAIDSSDEAQEPLTLANARPLLEETIARASRPVFSSDQPSDADKVILDYLSRWPPRDEAEEIVSKLRELPPLTFATLTRVAYAEKVQRERVVHPGLHIDPKEMDQTALDLIDTQLVEVARNRIALNDEGRRVARMLPIGKARPTPPWADEVLAPLTRR
jgi:hypothetical protein